MCCYSRRLITCLYGCVLFQTGETEAKAQGQETNQMATYIMECGGMERIEQLQMHDNNSIYNKVRRMKTYAHFFKYTYYLVFRDLIIYDSCGFDRLSINSQC